MCKQGAPPLPLPMLAGRYTIIILVFAFLLPAPLAVEIPPSDCDGNKYAANSTFQANLNLLAAALPVNASVSPAGFATLGFGTAPAQANGLALCRGDTNASTCAACVAAAFQDAQQLCPLYMGATVYRGACVLRFANWQFLDFLKEGQWLVSEFLYDLFTSNFQFFPHTSIASSLVWDKRLTNFATCDKSFDWYVLGERQRLGCLVQRRRHGDLQGSSRPRGGDEQRDEEVLRHGRDGLRPQALRTCAVRAGSHAGAVPGVPPGPRDDSDDAVFERAAALD